MEGEAPKPFFQNLSIAAGLAEGSHRGPSYNDGDFYKWIEAASALLSTGVDPALERRLDQFIAVIARAQRPDGYIHSGVQIRTRDGDSRARALADPLQFECYNLGHLLTAACVHHRATGKTEFLNVARGAAGFLAEALRERAADLARCSICPSHYMGVVELYRTTRDLRFLELAQRLIALRDTVVSGTDDNQDRVPLLVHRKLVGHAVRANYLYAGVADLCAETGDAGLLKTLHSVWDDLVTRKLAITGGCGALYDGASPDGSPDQKSIARVHQSYGRDYQLPSSTAHNETCAAIGLVLWSWRMLGLTGEARFADVLEQVLYNATLAGVSLDGTRYFYTNTLRQLDTMPTELRWSRRREPFINAFCCPPNVARTLAEVSQYAYGVSRDRIWFHLYGSGKLDTQLENGPRWIHEQETDYPWSGRIRITVKTAPSRDCSLMLRIPGWTHGASLEVNGERDVGLLESASYREIQRRWSPGDVIELDLPMPAVFLEAHPLVEEARNQIAVRRGPVVYCLESSDLPSGVRVGEVGLTRGTKLTPRREPGSLGGITILEGRAEARLEGDWSGKLYRELSTRAARPVDLRLIPYYVWSNRGPSEMTVWMPLGG
jgi:DUF1680 family protein